MDKPQPVQTDFGMDKLYVWVKALETKVNALLRETDMIKNNFTEKAKNMNKEVRMLNDNMVEIKRQQLQINQKIDLIVKELKQTAGGEELQTLKKYVDLWNPLHFVTQRDVERVVEAKLEKYEKGNNTKTTGEVANDVALQQKT